MKLKNLLFVLFFFSASFLVAQTTEVIADWEAAATSYDYTSFGNGHFGDSMFVAISNPQSSGINTSDTVATWWKANDAATWGGLTIVPTEEINFRGSVAELCIKVWADHTCDVLLKVEGSTTSDPASLLMAYTTPNQWQELCFDYSVADDQGDVGLGHIFTKVSLFLNFGSVPAADVQYLFDDLTKTTGGLYVDPDQQMISDNEPGDTTDIFAFGNGHFGDSTFSIVSNPVSDNINSSANVHAWCEANDASGWGGFGLILDTIDFTGDKAFICISMLIDHDASIRIKAAGSQTGADIRIEEDYTTPGAWQQICFDFSQPGINDNVGQGHLYTRLDFYLDYGSAQASDDCYHFDNILIISNGTGEVPQLIENLINANSELSTFKSFVEAVDLWGEINKNGVTVFAPSNAAFDAMPSADRDSLDNNVDNAIYNMIFHHMAYDSLPADLLTDGLVFITRNGQDGTVSGTSINGANINSSEEAINGFLHALDGVMQYPTDPDMYLYTDFEGNGSEDDAGWWWWGTDNYDAFKIIANPYKEGINMSDTVAEYKKFPFGLWYQGIASNNNRPYNFYENMTKVCFDIYAPDGEHKLFLKLDGSLTPNVKSGWYSLPFAGGQWSKVCFDATNPDHYDDTRTGVDNIFPGTTLFFDSEDQTLPADTAIFYMDNWRTENATAVGTKDISKLEMFKIFPNPATDYLYINTDKPIKTASVFDVTGKIMFSVDDPDNNEIKISSLETGMYFIKIIGYEGENYNIRKFIKK